MVFDLLIALSTFLLLLGAWISSCVTLWGTWPKNVDPPMLVFRVFLFAIIFMSRLTFLILQGFIVTFQYEYNVRFVLSLAQQISIILIAVLIIIWTYLTFNRSAKKNNRKKKHPNENEQTLYEDKKISMKSKRSSHSDRYPLLIE
jgi:uncharacterized membrane protein